MKLHDITKQIRAFADQLEEQNKPDAPPFQLPPPPPGMSWQKEKWTADMLPQGTRPLAFGEQICKDDEFFAWNEGPWKKAQDSTGGDTTGNYIGKDDVKYRTTRPLVFWHAGKSWTYHRPGDPMPCDGEAFVGCLCDNEGELTRTRAKRWTWKGNIIGWRYAEPETQEVELGPEDVPPGSVVRPDHWTGTVWVNVEKICVTDCLLAGENGKSHPWAYLKVHGWLINRPKHRDENGNPTLWEKCSKTITTP